MGPVGWTGLGRVSMIAAVIGGRWGEEQKEKAKLTTLAARFR